MPSARATDPGPLPDPRGTPARPARACVRGRRRAGLGLAAVLLASCGCADELGPERFRTTAITGTLTLGGRGLGPGWLEILPTDGTTGHLRSARVERDGTFRADGVPVGEVAMRMVGFPPVGTGLATTDRFLRDVRQVYAIRRKIGPAGGRLAIELTEEAARGAREGT
jgi:hypothetical protein